MVGQRSCLAVGTCLVLTAVATASTMAAAGFGPGNPWGWRCVNHTCVKEENNGGHGLLNLGTCKLTCSDDSVLWPRPTGMLRIGKETAYFLVDHVELGKIRAPSPEVEQLVREAFTLFNSSLAALSPSGAVGLSRLHRPFVEQVERHRVVVEVVVSGRDTWLAPGTREAYTLSIITHDHTTAATILATDFFGARHGLETLSQLIISDEDTGLLQVVTTAAVTDAPAFRYRGLLLDTSRNFVSVPTMKRTLDAMAASKLNTLHWHITDTHSFPLALNSLPNMAYYGAYSARQVYTPAQVRDLVQYARVRGVRLLPEIDAPAHVGNGWQWAEKEGMGRLVLCMDQEPWQEYCEDPPCGQFNPALNATYSLLGLLYIELLQLLPPQHYFHYGGSQINLNCWNVTEEVIQYLEQTGRGRGPEDLYDLWGEFQLRARDLVTTASPQVSSGIVRSSALTEEARRGRHLDPGYYVVQVTTPKAGEHVRKLVQEGYGVIMSDMDTWDLSCGLGDPHNEGPGPCGLYRGWQAVYGGPLPTDKGPGSVLGGEALLWTHQVDDTNLDAKLWPRAAAVAERLWTNPGTTWHPAETRFIHHRQRLVQRGVQADRIQPQWCHQNEGLCYVL